MESPPTPGSLLRARVLRIVRGTMPKPLYLVSRFYLKLGYLPNLVAPRTFNEKVLAKMLYDRTPLLRVVADKIAVRDFIGRRVGAAYLPRVHAVWQSADELELRPEWERIVIKASHGSGYVKLVPDVLKADVPALRRLVRGWLESNYGATRGEWCYRGIQPRAFAEEMLGDGDAEALVDYKLFCFEGVPRFIKIIKGMKGTTRSLHATLDFADMRISDGQLPLTAQTAPPGFDEMLRVASELSAGFDMLRVDMFNVDGRIYVGELTNYPQAGIGQYRPQRADGLLGEFWDRRSMRYLPLARLPRRLQRRRSEVRTGLGS
jgi:hypothetical protein